MRAPAVAVVAAALLVSAAGPAHAADPFFMPPSQIQDAPLGAIIRQRPLPYQLPPLLASSTDTAWQVLFRTQDNAMQPAVAVTTVLAPRHANWSAALSYQVAYDSPCPQCAPSTTLQNSSSIAAQLDMVLIAAALQQGWVVNIPDHEGLNAAYLCGRQSAYTIWDSLRALERLQQQEVPSMPFSIGLWGYSGGAIATGWALEFHQSYGFIPIIGAALGGLDPDLVSAYHTVNEGLFAGLAVSASLGISKGYPDFASYLRSELLPERVAAFDAPLTTCDAIASFALQDINEYFRRGAEATRDPRWVGPLEDAGTLGRYETPSMPLYVYAAVHDEISAISRTDALIGHYCQDDARVLYVRNLLGEHLTEAIVGAPAAFRWMQGQFAGAAAPTSCRTMTRALAPVDINWPQLGVLSPLGALVATLTKTTPSASSK